MGNCTTSLPIPENQTVNFSGENLRGALAGAQNDDEMLETLIFESNLDVNLTMEDEELGSCYPIHIATKAGNLKAVMLLIKAGADTSLQDGNGNTALHIAAKGSDLDLAEELVKGGSNVDALSTDQKTPLVVAILCNQDQMVDKLMALGADINIADDSGDQPIMIAIKNSNMSACLALLKGSLSPTPETALAFYNWAVENGQTEIMEILEKTFPEVIKPAKEDEKREGGDGAEETPEVAEEPAAEEVDAELVVEDTGTAPEEEPLENPSEEEPTEEPPAEEPTEEPPAEEPTEEPPAEEPMEEPPAEESGEGEEPTEATEEAEAEGEPGEEVGEGESTLEC